MTKKYLILSIFALLAGTLYAQGEMPDNAVMPSFPGGETALLEYLKENVQYPDLARENNIEGTVALAFIVERNGSITNVTILRDIGGGCGVEARRVVEAMPNWTPGMVDEKPVRVRFTLPVRFRLEEPVKKKWWQREGPPRD